MIDPIVLTSRQSEVILDTLNRLINPWLIILFGSYAKGRAREESDIDLAFLTDQGVDDYQSFCIAQELSELIGKPVDCVNLYSASTVFQVQIIGYGKVLFCEDETRRKYYYVRTYKEYALLNEERTIILKQIKERGTIYG
ncbi:type VII toxin-antitoxin system MntA family adenylyltransferase antitoxin [Desulfosporosinus hippei]|uniref:Nucleotidyltransferase domain-containing protein n=1 Tax=Desulfosporosinus hippei DSM 8344 TaxID=1121419 RepID=A0A1G8H5X7_9FIRM|nr:nucleotidyltransferase domain-containing protein [Desulfosporosinus hippei]SDI02052.1 Nucleotidyltransferase domain-containing protein [Desulfosporosinus hippei DSM 8344]